MAAPQPRPALPKACIIGAGCTGLITAKALQDRGIAFDCFEVSDRVGGIWAFENPNGRSGAYRSLHIDTSKSRLQLDDHPVDPALPDYLHHSQVLDYIRSYAERFDLLRHVTLNTEVHRAVRRADGLWQVSLSTGETRLYDALFVCNGHHWSPHWPNPPYPGSFDGAQIHSQDYRDPFAPLDFRGKRVVVVGMGNSAMDVACELCPRHIAQRLTVVMRRGVYIFPRFMLGQAADKGRLYPWMPVSLQLAFGRLVYRWVVGRMENYGLPKPDHRLFESHGTVSDGFASHAAAGDIVIKRGIERLDGSHVVFTDGSREPVDAIVWATGYKIAFPFLDDSFLQVRENRLPLFKRMFKPGVDNLIFIGLAQSTITVFALAERQAKFAAAYLAGDYALPSQAEMERAIPQDERRHLGRYYASQRHTMQLDQDVYFWELERELRHGRRRARAQGQGWLPVPGRAAAGAALSTAA